MFSLKPLLPDWLTPVLSGLVPPPDRHDHTDYDGCRDNDPEKVLNNYRAGVRSGDDICDQTVDYNERNAL